MASKVNLNMLTDCINANISENIFPDELKLTDITSAFKNEDSTLKVNYRGISILSAYSKNIRKTTFTSDGQIYKQ